MSEDPLNDLSDDFFFESADEEQVKREKSKARELRRSQWWKNQLGKGRCHYCGANCHPSELTMDHVVPIIRGGKSVRGNVVPACLECNQKKSCLVPSEWGEYLKRLSGKQ